MPPMPWRLVAMLGVAGVLSGAVFGFVRGLDYLPTLPVAIFEGGILFGVPAVVLGLIVAGLWAVFRGARRPGD